MKRLAVTCNIPDRVKLEAGEKAKALGKPVAYVEFRGAPAE